MEIHEQNILDFQQDRLLTTLESLLSIDAMQLRLTLHQGAQLLGEALACEKVDVFHYEPESHTLVALGTSDSQMSRHQKALGLDWLPLANRGRTVEAFLTGRAFINGRVDQDEAELRGIRTPPPDGLGVISQIAARIKVQNKPRGVLLAASDKPEYFGEKDLRFLEAAASWMGMIMHRAELAERQTQEAMQKGRRLAAEQLLTIMAHDLKNYLTPLRLRLDLLSHRANRAQNLPDIRDLAIAKNSLTRLDRLIGNLLDVARLDQGLFVLSPEAIDIVNLVKDLVPLLSTPNTNIQVRGPEELVCLADPARLRQLLENLLANAVKHAPELTPVRVSIASEQRDNGTWVLVSIHNQGAPIQEDILHHLFEPFVHGNSSVGLGLGLFLARSIALAHHGDLTVTSDVAQGTQFTLSLPLVQNDMPKNSGLPSPEELQMLTPQSQDDEEDERTGRAGRRY